MDVVARHVSPPLSEAVKVILKVSLNLHADMLPLIIGAVRGGSGTRREGLERIRAFLRSERLDPDRIVLADGSGLSRADRLSARFLVGLLRWAMGRDWWPEFRAALPAGGVDGTLAARFRAPPLSGRVRAKTGTFVSQGPGGACLYESKSLAGYLEPGAGKDPIVFAIIFSNVLFASRSEGADALLDAQEEILCAVADLYSR
jgi:D-alanyl-D-alanine carboxypeptidase/D-alanyl-D-alanine-endopeptidase (penicillin-binding protein 4)